MAADSNALGALHSQVAGVLSDMLRPREEPIFDKEGNDTGKVRMIYPTAAEISAAVTFLKNNNITADADHNEELKKLRDAMEARQAARRKPLVLDDPHAGMPLMN